MKKSAVILLLSLVIVPPILAGETTQLVLDPLQYEPSQDTLSFGPTFGFFWLGYISAGTLGLLVPLFVVGGLGAEPTRAVVLASSFGGAAIGSGMTFYIASTMKRR